MSLRLLKTMTGVLAALGVVACAPAHFMPGPPPLLIWHPPQPAPRPPAPDVPASYLVLLPDADGAVGQVNMQTAQGRQTLRKPKEAADLVGGASTFAVTDAQLQRDFGAAMGARPVLPERFRIYYASGTSRLSPEALATVGNIIQRSQQFSALEVLVVGHTDAAGRSDANYQLGLERARQFAEILIAQGIRAVNIEVGSAGESQPVVYTADGKAEPRNRRIEVTLR